MLPGAARFEAIIDDVGPGRCAPRPPTAAPRCWCAAPTTPPTSRWSRGSCTSPTTEGLDTLADLWSGSPADSLAGCLWRLYLLRAWVYADPAAAAREFDAGRRHTPVHEVVAGVVDPPGPDEVRRLTDLVLRGVVQGDFADTLVPRRGVRPGRRRPAAPTSAPATPRTPYDSDLSAARLLTLAEQLEHAAALELDGLLA